MDFSVNFWGRTGILTGNPVDAIAEDVGNIDGNLDVIPKNTSHSLRYVSSDIIPYPNGWKRKLNPRQKKEIRKLKESGSGESGLGRGGLEEFFGAVFSAQTPA
ncbi:MAG: hypothetical protein VKK42_25930 [Lyngbya sp.]|nr:hypothetical protein [Lyngbya sp.]